MHAIWLVGVYYAPLSIALVKFKTHSLNMCGDVNWLRKMGAVVSLSGVTKMKEPITQVSGARVMRRILQSQIFLVHAVLGPA